MLDFGAGELVVIGVVALVAIGPKELPGVLRTVGQVVGRMRRMASDFQSQFNDALRDAELAEARKAIEDIHSQAASLHSVPVTEHSDIPVGETGGSPGSTESAINDPVSVRVEHHNSDAVVPGTPKSVDQVSVADSVERTSEAVVPEQSGLPMLDNHAVAVVEKEDVSSKIKTSSSKPKATDDVV